MAERNSPNANNSDLSHELKQSSREFIEENLKGALLDWLEEQPLYKDESAKDKRAQQNIVKVLADKLISIVEQSPSHEDNIDSLLLEEIKKYIRKLPLNSKLKLDQTSIDKLPYQLLDCIKGLKLFHDISQRDDQSSIDMNITKWVNSLPLSKNVLSYKDNMDDLKEKFIENVKQTGLQYEPKLREEAKQFLRNISLEVEDGKEKEKLLIELEDALIEFLSNNRSKFNSTQLLSNKFVIETVEQWAKTLVLPKQNSDNFLAGPKTYLISTLSNKFVYADEVPYKDFRDVFLKETNQFLKNIPGHRYKAEDIDILAKSLQDTFKEYSKKYPIYIHNRKIKKKGAVVLLEDIAEWVKKLPFETNTPEDQSESEKIKLELESMLIHKIGVINMNFEVFNDDFLYENALEDEIDSLLQKIQSKNVIKSLPKLKRDLIHIVLKARQSILDENANQTYKRQLHKIISKTLPPTDWSEEGRASLEVLKDDVANAFINMHYVDNDEEINKLKEKINNKVYEFCNEYLKRCPATPLDTSELNNKLYNALSSVAEPQNESFSDDVEIVKLKHEINNWVENLPLKDRDVYDKLQTNKLVSTLANKLHNIENEKDVTSSQDYNAKLLKEITRFLKRQLIKTDNDDEINWLAEILAKDLNDTEKMRKLNVFSKKPFISPPAQRKPQINITFRDVSTSPCTEIQAKVKDYSFGTCMKQIPKRCLVEKCSSVQTPCVRMVPIGSQTGVCPAEDYNEDYYWDPKKEICAPPPRASCPSPANYHAPCEPGLQYSQQPYLLPQDGQSTQEALKSCLITKPYPPQPSQFQLVRQHQVREPYEPLDYSQDYHLHPQPPSCKPAYMEAETQSGNQGSTNPNRFTTSTPYSTLDHINQSQIRQSASWQLPQSEGQTPLYPYHLSTEPPPDRRVYNFNRPPTESCTQNRARGQPCPMSHQVQGQRSVIESQYIPNEQQNSAQIPPKSYKGPPRHIQDQPWMDPDRSETFSPPLQIPCPPKPPLCPRTKPPMSTENYNSEQNNPVAYSRPLTQLESSSSGRPQSCLTRIHKSEKRRDDERPWQSDRGCFHTDEEFNQREDKRCRCNQKFDEYYVRRLL